MTDYTKTTNFTAKDALPSGDPNKLVKGSLFDTEFDNIATAVATKYDSNDIASQAQAEALASNSVLMTPAAVSFTLEHNAGMLADIKALADPGVDMVLGWDDSASAVIGWTLGDGIESTVGGALQLPASLAGNGLAIASGVLSVNVGEGIFLESDTVKLSDVAAGAAQPVVVTDGTFTFDLSSITEITAEGIAQAGDGLVISDAGTIKVMPWDQAGCPVESTAANKSFDATDIGTIQVNTGTGITWTIDPTSTTDLEIGAFILLCNEHATGDLTITAGTGVTLYSTFNAAGTTATSDVLSPGGSAVLVHVAADTWHIAGDIADA
jgi:hypothetical protein